MSRYIIVVFGSGYGSQLAERLGPALPDGRIPVMKWRRQGRKWTGRILIRPDQVRGMADLERIDEARRQGAFLA